MGDGKIETIDIVAAGTVLPSYPDNHGRYQKHIHLDANGDVPPKYRIFGDETTLKKPFGVALNPEHKELYVSDMRLNGVVTFRFPELFEE